MADGDQQKAMGMERGCNRTVQEKADNGGVAASIKDATPIWRNAGSASQGIKKKMRGS